jgi:hypothetical protein
LGMRTCVPFVLWWFRCCSRASASCACVGFIPEGALTIGRRFYVRRD